MWLLWNSLEKRQCSTKLLGKIEAVFPRLQVKDSSGGWCREWRGSSASTGKSGKSTELMCSQACKVMGRALLEAIPSLGTQHVLGREGKGCSGQVEVSSIPVNLNPSFLADLNFLSFKSYYLKAGLYENPSEEGTCNKGFRAYLPHLSRTCHRVPSRDLQ